MRVLIVDDEPSVRAYLDTFLTRNGFNTVSAPSSAHADALLLDFPGHPDIALVDLWLKGGLDGPSYSDTLRPRYPDIQVIFITGWQEQDQTLAAAQMRGHVLFKPFTGQELLDTIRATVDGRAP